MSHEIRTPINAMLGMNEMIIRESKNPSIVTYAQNVKQAGKTLLGLINDILDFSKIESGKLQIIKADYDLASVLCDLVNLVKGRMEDKGIKFNLAFDKDMPRYLNGDELRIKQTITNLLTNAVKYTEKGSVTFAVGYEQADRESNTVVLTVSVKATGIGIKKEDMTKLFDKFERFDERRNKNIEGTGLGLNITQELLALMDSKLDVESEYGSGSEFSFKLKQDVVIWEPLGDYNESFKSTKGNVVRRSGKFTAPNAKILIVDDSAMNVVVFKKLIKQNRIQTVSAGNGDDAVKLAAGEKYDAGQGRYRDAEGDQGR